MRGLPFPSWLAAAVAAYGGSIEAHRRGGWILGVAGVRARLACVASELGDRGLAVATLADLPADLVPGEEALVAVARALVRIPPPLT